MAPVNSKALFAILLLLGSNVFAAPLARRQLHGEGVAADALLTDTDNGVGYGTENAEDNLAALITNTKPAGTRRQLHGEGVAADALLTDTDNGVGYGTENAEDNLAALITNTKGSTKRQADKISKGAQAVSSALGTGAATQNPTDSIDTIDGATTDGAANIGTDTGTMEAATLEAAGSAVPTSLKQRRQADKISNGAQAVSNALGTGAATTTVTDSLDTIDGASTDGAANLGTDTGAMEASTLEAAGSAVPSKITKRWQA